MLDYIICCILSPSLLKGFRKHQKSNRNDQRTTGSDKKMKPTRLMQFASQTQQIICRAATIATYSYRLENASVDRQTCLLFPVNALGLMIFLSLMYEFHFITAIRHSRLCICQGLLHFLGGLSHSAFSLMPYNMTQGTL